MAVKGDLKLEIDEQGLEVRVTIVPDDSGADLSPDSLLAMLAEKKVREGIDTEAIEKGLRDPCPQEGRAGHLRRRRGRDAAPSRARGR